MPELNIEQSAQELPPAIAQMVGAWTDPYTAQSMTIHRQLRIKGLLKPTDSAQVWLVYVGSATPDVFVLCLVSDQGEILAETSIYLNQDAEALARHHAFGCFVFRNLNDSDERLVELAATIYEMVPQTAAA